MGPQYSFSCQILPITWHTWSIHEACLTSQVLDAISDYLLCSVSTAQSHGHPRTLSSRNHSTSKPMTFCSSGSFHLVIFHSVNFPNLLRPLLFPCSPYLSSMFCLLFLPCPGRLSRFMTLSSDLCPQLRFSNILLFHLPDKTWDVYLESSCPPWPDNWTAGHCCRKPHRLRCPKVMVKRGFCAACNPTTLPGPLCSFF